MPIIFYLFLYQGEYKYETLPVLKEKLELEQSYEQIFKNKLTVVCFLGSESAKTKASLFNLNQLIYKRFQKKPFFQIMALIPEKSQNDFQRTMEELKSYTELDRWHFLFKEEKEIEAFFKNLQTACKLDDHYYSPYAFIIDANQQLRGRQDVQSLHCGYDITNVSELKKEMRDDISILYYAGLRAIEL